ncbi:MAG: hypothetical protein ACE5J9_04775 [Methanosarcinales archaeon]
MDQNLPWEIAMKSAAEELGLNKAEDKVIIYRLVAISVTTWKDYTAKIL